MNKQGKGKIEYLDWTWNPITGCLHDCDYCYMKRMAARFPQVSMEPKFHRDRLYEPMSLKKPSIIGVSYSGDMWGKWVPGKWIRCVIDVIKASPRHRFLFLTKNPKRYGDFEIPLNCWCGTSVTGCSLEDELVEHQRVISLIVNAPEKRCFLSMEPFIGFRIIRDSERARVWAEKGIGWVIVGGLTGKGRKQPASYHLREYKNYCSQIGVPVFIKSNAGYPEKIQEYPEGLKL